MAFYESKKIASEIARKTIIEGENYGKVLGRLTGMIGAVGFVGVGSVALALRIFGY